MKERPIIFDAESMRGILDGSKTQTRRLAGLWEINKDPNDWKLSEIFPGRRWSFSSGEFSLNLDSPFGASGERLWVKESGCRYRRYGQQPGELQIDRDDKELSWPILNAMFFPRSASRATLEIVSVRPERLQAITLDEICNEGLRVSDSNWAAGLAKAWIHRWDSINGKRKKDKPDVSWSANPWVWRIEVKKVTP